MLARDIGDTPFVYTSTQEDLKFEFSEWLVNTENLPEFIELFQKFFSSSSNSSADNTSKINFSFKNIYFESLISNCKLILTVENAHLYTIFGKNSNYHFVLDSAQLFLKPTSESLTLSLTPKSYLTTLQNLQFSLISSVTDLEIFFTAVNKEENSASELNKEVSPPFIECMLSSNECKPIYGQLYISQDVRTQILKEEYLEIHANVGCLIININKDIIVNLSKILNEMTQNPEENMSRFENTSSDSVNLQIFLDEDAKFPDPLMQNSSVQSSEIYHAHLDIQNLRNSNTINSEFHQISAKHGFPKLKTSLSLFHLRINLYSTSKILGVIFKSENIGVSYAKFPQLNNYS